MAKILFNELVKETQKRLIVEAIQESFNIKPLGIEIKLKGVQVFRDLFSNYFPLTENELADEEHQNYHYVLADTDKGTFQLLWDVDAHCFDFDYTLYKQKKGIELPPVQAPEPVKKPKRNPKKDKKKDEVQEDKGNAQDQVS